MEKKSKSSPASSDLAKVIQSGHAKHHSKVYIVVIVLILLAGFGIWRFSGNDKKHTATHPPFATAPLAKRDIRLVVTATGNLLPTNKVSVGSEVSGTTLEVFVDINDQVTEGQPLARLDTRIRENELRASRASLESSKARVLQAEATLKMEEAALARKQELSRLSDGKMPSRADMDVAEAAVARAKADLMSAEASVAQAEAQIDIRESDLEKALIRAPCNGIVLTRSIEPGQTVAASFSTPELFVIAEDLSRMKLEVAVAEADIGRLAAGQKATFSVDAWPGRSYAASVRRVAFGSVISDNVVSYITELDVSNDDLSLRPGMTATVDIEVASATDVWAVPVESLRFRPVDPGAAFAGPAPKKSFMENLMPRPPMRRRPNGNGSNGAPGREVEPSRIWVLKAGKPEPVVVEVGLTDGRFSQVTSEALVGGMEVVLRANMMMKP